ncbi:hypothetical protein PM3016_4499 [Paenibacillus mucilaginosus 3016]|uniref:Uncharacterized protein n=2 Tax=Paenibacillus mucilaginosus TaxID=61624 RepID=H6NB05_9BACL|nr:hypothetical protein [Paenibacillus mucilaginosus]AFC31260.1 hypothetical protein PM3016_4499 [Paenibacillus mucilaginosus 3016]AFH63586.1 hypothetical protein B2K_23305 [Paenibacillus mucilaginosus K02]WFA19825.1 hypothetical protein ERY13_22560 [Paenibacillus mucilaginosus]
MNGTPSTDQTSTSAPLAPQQKGRPGHPGFWDYVHPSERPMTVKDWVITQLILALPVINLVMLFVWAFGKTSNVNRRNYCRASLWMFLFVMVLYLLALVGLLLYSNISPGGIRFS